MERVEAIKAGVLRYNTGRPCKHGHLSDRYTTSGACAECIKISNADKPKSYQLRAQPIVALRKLQMKMQDFNSRTVPCWFYIDHDVAEDARLILTAACKARFVVPPDVILGELFERSFGMVDPLTNTTGQFKMRVPPGHDQFFKRLGDTFRAKRKPFVSVPGLPETYVDADLGRGRRELPETD